MTSLPSKLPSYLHLKQVYVDAQLSTNNPIVQNIRSNLPQAQFLVLKKIDDCQKGSLIVKQFKGKFLRFCPGTRYYNCCGYKIVHFGENCPLACSYCILQAYFQDNTLKIWGNINDLYEELDRTLRSNPNLRYRTGTGEFTDSLVLEPITGYAKHLVQFLADYSNIRIELKSKVVDLSWLSGLNKVDHVLPAWSLNSPDIAQKEEKFTSSLEQRLKAAKTCTEKGLKVCLHFDPIIHYPGWEKGYATVIEMIFDYLKPEHICYFSLGSFRGMPTLFKTIEQNHPQVTYIYDEYVPGLDGKLRLFLPLRLKIFSFIVNKLKQAGLDKQIYFCMESDLIWEKILGYTPQKLGGLNKHLENLSFDNLI
ncbi:MAG: radical SAM protein [Desulfonauticus sp.]|nr:radical SAM protein [Desulfonauticus sp.]